jgi:peptide/nickel transport system ATP-binding protein
MPLLSVNNLNITFTKYTKGLKQEEIQVIRDLNLSIDAGEMVAIVGASGSGKSLLAHAILGILPSNAKVTGQMVYNGEELTEMKKASLRGKEIALVPQSVQFLNPLMKVGAQVQSVHNRKGSALLKKQVFEKYKLGSFVEKLFPFQLSGGMARRVLVSTAVVSGAKVIIADEPTPGLDAEVIKEAGKSFRELADHGSAVMIITHDIEFALQFADKIAVLYAGTTIEVASVRDFTGDGERLRHPYTKALWRALPQNGFVPIKGSQPLPNQLPKGCPFVLRCELAVPSCSEEMPKSRNIREGTVWCDHAT